MKFRALTTVVAWMWVCLCSAQFPNTEYGNPSGSARFGFDQDFGSIGRSRSIFGHSPSFISSSNGQSRSFDSSGRFSNNNFGQFGTKNQNNFDFQPHHQQKRPEFPLNNNEESPSSSQQGQIQKFISVHIAPPEEEPLRLNNRGQGSAQKPEKHYQIVFIKAPSTTNRDLEEIELPPAPETKTLVYVLLKKPSARDILKVRGQALNSKPTPPEVFFIRYKGKNQTAFENGDISNNKKSKGEGEGGTGGGGGYENSDDFEKEQEDFNSNNEYGNGVGSASHFK